MILSYPVAMFQTLTSRSQPPLTKISPHGTIVHTPITWPCSVFWFSPLASYTWILALSIANTIYLGVRCSVVTTPKSGVTYWLHLPLLFHADSTMYFCLKWDRYEAGRGRCDRPGALLDDMSRQLPDRVRSKSELPSVELASARLGFRRNVFDERVREGFWVGWL